MPAVDDWGNRDIFVLSASRRGFAPLLHRDALGLAAFAFSDVAAARAMRDHFAAATQRKGTRVEILTLAARDARAREEWLSAVDGAGGARVLFDPQPSAGGPPPRGVLTRALLADVLSGKRFVACL
jgi:hypothetical protein